MKTLWKHRNDMTFPNPPCEVHGLSWQLLLTKIRLDSSSRAQGWELYESTENWQFSKPWYCENSAHLDKHDQEEYTITTVTSVTRVKYILNNAEVAWNWELSKSLDFSMFLSARVCEKEVAEGLPLYLWALLHFLARVTIPLTNSIFCGQARPDVHSKTP